MVTIYIVAQSGHAWEEIFETLEDAENSIPEIVETHGDIERVELLDKDGFHVKNLWKME